MNSDSISTSSSIFAPNKVRRRERVRRDAAERSFQMFERPTVKPFAQHGITI